VQLPDWIALAIAAAPWLIGAASLYSGGPSRDWHALHLVRRGHQVHVRTDPRCVLSAPPRRGSPLDRRSRGVLCPRCHA
jgi:hypothetical protein